METSMLQGGGGIGEMEPPSEKLKQNLLLGK